MNKTRQLLISLLTLLCCCTGAWAQSASDVLCGEFTVNESGDKVQFSKGNLQYVDGNWQFAEYQYEYFVTTQSASHCDIFAFNSYTFPDDGVSWRILSQSEWAYLISTRNVNNTLSEGALYSKTTIGGTYVGVIIFPDNYTHPSDADFSGNCNNATEGYTSTVSLEGWAKMEAAGCVFLPAAGYGHAYNDLYYVNSACLYTSSTEVDIATRCTPGFYYNRIALDDKSSNSTLIPVRLVLTKSNSGGEAESELVQDAEGYYLLGTAQNWKEFAALAQTTPTANAKMTADIDLGNDQTMVGTLSVPYQGAFDGQGHTLTVNYDIYLNTNAVAPFAVVSDAIIQRLHVDGSIKQQKCAAGGVAGTIMGNLTVRECWVSAYMYVQGSGSLQGTIGGIASYCDDPNVTGCEILIEDCLFTGELGTGYHCGSIMSHVNGGYGNHATLRNCLNMGKFPNPSGSTGTFIRPIQGESFDIDNCFYKSSFGYVQGTQATDKQLANGSIASALQARHSEQVWVQDMNLGMPMLMVFSENPDPDGINSLTPNPSPRRGEIYNLSGQIVNGKWLNGKLPRGIFIIGGKKVVIR